MLWGISVAIVVALLVYAVIFGRWLERDELRAEAERRLESAHEQAERRARLERNPDLKPAPPRPDCEPELRLADWYWVTNCRVPRCPLDNEFEHHHAWHELQLGGRT